MPLMYAIKNSNGYNRIVNIWIVIDAVNFHPFSELRHKFNNFTGLVMII